MSVQTVTVDPASVSPRARARAGPPFTQPSRLDIEEFGMAATW